MGKPTGFLEFERADRKYEPVEARVKHWHEFVVPLAEPDSVGLCFVLVPPGRVDSLAALNRFTKQVWTHVSVDGRDELGHYPFILSKTEVDVAHYGPHLEAMLGPAVLERPDADALMLLRVLITNPFLREWSEREPGFDEIFCAYLDSVVREVRNGTEWS